MITNKTIAATGITLKAHDLGEADRILVLFTREHGVIRAVAKGVKKTVNKFGGRLDLLNVNSLMIRQGRNLGTITQCDTYQTFPLLRKDFDKLVYSLFMGELILLFSNDGEPSEEVFELLLFTLEKMENFFLPLSLTIWFEMRMLSILGYYPNLTSCEFCQEEIPPKSLKLGLSLSTGSIICENCLRFTSNYKLITDQMRAILKVLQVSDFEEMADFVPDEATLERIQIILKEYFSNLSERKIKTLTVFETT